MHSQHVPSTRASLTVPPILLFKIKVNAVAVVDFASRGVCVCVVRVWDGGGTCQLIVVSPLNINIHLIISNRLN
jgi:hypothetical protein